MRIALMFGTTTSDPRQRYSHKHERRTAVSRTAVSRTTVAPVEEMVQSLSARVLAIEAERSTRSGAVGLGEEERREDDFIDC